MNADRVRRALHRNDCGAIRGTRMPDGRAGAGVIRRLVDAEWSANAASADPDDPLVRGFAEFGLPPHSPLATGERLRDLEEWQADLQIPANSAFLDSTLLLTVEALLGSNGPDALTPVTLWELTAFIDALTCFDRLYCIANPVLDVSRFNRRLGADVLTAIPDPDGGMLRRLAAQAAADGVSNMSSLREQVGPDDAFAQEVEAVVDGWRAVLGPDFPSDGPFDTKGVDIRLVNMNAPATSAESYDEPYEPGEDLSVVLIDGTAAISGDVRSRRRLFRSGREEFFPIRQRLGVLIDATRLPRSPADSVDRPPLSVRRRFAASATYRTYVNQGVANALALPYMPGTLRMPFRRLFVERAAEVQDELVSVALADQIFASQQPSSPLILPFFTASVLQEATAREDVWAQMARVRDQSAAFRRHRAELDHMLARSQVSPAALRVQNAIRDEALKLADLAGAAQQSASVALGVVAQTGIVPLAGALKTGVDAAQGLGRNGSWTRVWRRLFHRHEYFLTQTNSQAIALTNALPQIQQLWEMPKIGAYLKQFASATQQMGHVLRD
jgi:hypothetical protein